MIAGLVGKTNTNSSVVIPWMAYHSMKEEIKWNVVLVASVIVVVVGCCLLSTVQIEMLMPSKLKVVL